MRYEPYPVYDLRAGKVTAKEPWLVPKDAFPVMLDCHLRRGVLEKRKGYTEFGQIVHTNTTTEADTNPGNAVMGIWSYFQGNSTEMLAMDTERVNKYDAGVFKDLTLNKIRFQHASKQNWQPIPTSVIKGATSEATGTVAYVVVDTGTFGGSNANGTIVFANGTVSGTFQNGEELRNNANAAEIVGDADGANTDDEFTGDDADFFWFQNWKDIGYITNYKDQIQKYNGECLTRFNIDLDVELGPDNDVDTCLMIFVMKKHLILLRPKERGTEYYRRARWCVALTPTQWRDDDYCEADTEDFIIAADFIGSRLIVWFERSVWELVYTSDPDAPFRFEKISDTEGCYATFSIAAFSNELLAIGPTRMLSCDGRDVDGINDKIPDLVLEFNQEKIGYCYSLVCEEMDHVYTTYASQASDLPDRLAVLNFEEANWATYRLNAHCLGYWSVDDDLILDDIEDVLDTLDYSFDDKELMAGFPITLMGCRDGYVYKLNDSGADNGSAIAFEAQSGRWNPYGEGGQKASFGFIDFLVDVDDTISFDVDFYINQRTTSYLTKTITCEDTAGSGGDKVWKRIHVGQVADFHRIKISNDAIAQRPRIHAIVPWMKRSGRRG